MYKAILFRRTRFLLGLYRSENFVGKWATSSSYKAAKGFSVVPSVKSMPRLFPVLTFKPWSFTPLNIAISYQPAPVGLKQNSIFQSREQFSASCLASNQVHLLRSKKMQQKPQSYSHDPSNPHPPQQPLRHLVPKQLLHHLTIIRSRKRLIENIDPQYLT